MPLYCKYENLTQPRQKCQEVSHVRRCLYKTEEGRTHISIRINDPLQHFTVYSMCDIHTMFNKLNMFNTFMLTLLYGMCAL